MSLRCAGLDPLEQLVSQVVARWREEAKLLRAHGAAEAAMTKERDAADLEQEARAFSLEGLTLDQAAEESGYSYSALQKMVSTGRMVNVGSPGQPRIRRGDLPRKPGRGNESQKGEPDLAELVLAGRQ